MKIGANVVIFSTVLKSKIKSELLKKITAHAVGFFFFFKQEHVRIDIYVLSFFCSI